MSETTTIAPTCALGRQLDACQLRRRAGCTRLYDVLLYMFPPTAALRSLADSDDPDVLAWLRRLESLTEVHP